jgi:membrane-bound lytic murein transglycosylase D
MKAGFFGLSMLVLVAVNGMNTYTSTVATSPNTTVNPMLKQMQAFDSSFVCLSEFSDSILAELPQINLNSQAKSFVSNYIKKYGEDLAAIKAKRGFYFTGIDSIFNKYSIPVELKYLAVVESDLKTTACSPVGAVGMWQLMAPTARGYSLKVSGKYDERKNFYRSTKAAARHLKDLYAYYQDWLLVVAAYNSGAGTVDKAIKYVGSKNFWKIQNRLPAETRGHVKRFIATHYYFESCGSIATLTKAEAAAYKTTVSNFITKQKAIAESIANMKTDESKVSKSVEVIADVKFEQEKNKL